jgi:hypothetical protein
MTVTNSSRKGISIMEQCSPQNLHVICVKVGSQVILHKLKAKSQLNGIHGTVVYHFIETTGRVVVLLDISESKRPIAVKPENLHMFYQELK